MQTLSIGRIDPTSTEKCYCCQRSATIMCEETGVTAYYCDDHFLDQIVLNAPSVGVSAIDGLIEEVTKEEQALLVRKERLLSARRELLKGLGLPESVIGKTAPDLAAGDPDVRFRRFY